MGLLSTDRAAADYLPSDFAHEESRGSRGEGGGRQRTNKLLVPRLLPRCLDRQRNSKLQLEGNAALTSKIVVAFESASAVNIAMLLVASNASEHEAMRQLYARKVIRKFVARVAERRAQIRGVARTSLDFLAQILVRLVGLVQNPRSLF